MAEVPSNPEETEGDDTVNDPGDIEKVTEEDELEDVVDHGDEDDDESDTDTA